METEEVLEGEVAESVEFAEPAVRKRFGVVWAGVLIGVVLVVLVGLIVFFWVFSKPVVLERTIVVDRNLMGAVVYNGSVCDLSIADSVDLSKVKSVKFVFDNLSFFAPEVKKKYRVSAAELGIANFDDVKSVSAVIEYKNVSSNVDLPIPATNVISPNCSDRIKNGDETGVDCGGRCKACASSGGGGGGSSGGGGTSCSPFKDCADYYNLAQCGGGLSDGCSASLNCFSCNSGAYCLDGNCVNNNFSCVDSDAKDFFIKGNVTINNSGSLVFKEDACFGNLTEFFCFFNGTAFEAKNESVSCSFGCANGKCLMPSCNSDSNCSSLTGACGIGKCNLSSGSCFVSFSLNTTICRTNFSECDAVDYCSGNSVLCADNNKTNGAVCNGGTCLNGRCNASLPSCADDSGCSSAGGFCDGNRTYTCAFGTDGCLKRQNGSDCSIGQSCVWGACLQKTDCKLCDSLVLYMPFDSPSDSISKIVYDYSDYGNNGNVWDNAKYTSNGKYRGAFEFDGFNDYLEIPIGKNSDSLNFTGNFTISFWYKTKSFVDDDYIITSGQWTAARSGFGIIYSAPNQRIWVNLADGSAWKYNYKTVNLNDNLWHHLMVVFAYNGVNWGDTKLFVDGVSQNFDARTLNELTGTRVSGSDIGIGGFWAGAGNSVNGSIDELMFYKKALNNSEVIENYNFAMHSIVLRNAPVAYYQFEGDTKEDLSGAAGAVVGTSRYSDGVKGRAFNFDGRTYVNIGNFSQINGNSLTVSFWINPSWISGNGTILSKSQGSSANIELAQKNREITFNQANGQRILSGDILKPNLWQYVVVSWNGTYQKIYVGSKLIAVRPESTSRVNNLADALLGVRNVSGFDFFNGSVDELKFYNRELSANEIVREYSGYYGNGICEGGESWQNSPIDCSFYCKPSDSPLECSVSCINDSDCKDNSSITNDVCVEAGTVDSFCRHKLARNVAWCAGSFTDLRWPGAGRIPDEMINNCDFHADLLWTPGQNSTDLFNWIHQKGKIVMAPVHINDYLYKLKIPASEFETNKEFWIENITQRFKAPLDSGSDGIVYDEIRLPGDNPPMEDVAIALQRIKKQYPSKIIAVYGGRDINEINANDPAKIETMRRFLTFADVYLPEVYFSEDIVDVAGFSFADNLKSLLEEYIKFYPGAGDKMIFLAETGEEHDKKPGVDVDKLLDEQYFIVKGLINQGEAKGLGSFGAFSTRYPQNYWVAMLMKNYILDGKNSSLSDRVYVPNFLQNPGFDDGVLPWSVSSPSDGVVQARSIKEIDSGFPSPQQQPFGPSMKIPNGRQVLFLKRGSSPNVVSQTANIAAGKNYYLEVWSKKHSGDFGYSNVKIRLQNLAGAEIIYNYTRRGICTGISPLYSVNAFSECDASLSGAGKYNFWTKDEFVFSAPQNQVVVRISDENATLNEVSILDFVQLNENKLPFSGGALLSKAPENWISKFFGWVRKLLGF